MIDPSILQQLLANRAMSPQSQPQQQEASLQGLGLPQDAMGLQSGSPINQMMGQGLNDPYGQAPNSGIGPQMGIGGQQPQLQPMRMPQSPQAGPTPNYQPQDSANDRNYV